MKKYGEYFGEPNPTPAGFKAVRSGFEPQVNHLVILSPDGGNGGRPTMCGLTRFPQYVEGKQIPDSSGLTGWSLGGGVSGPKATQLDCPKCWSRATALKI